MFANIAHIISQLLSDPDQFFVALQHLVVGWLPVSWQPLVSVLLSIVAIICVFPGLFALITVVERKGLGRIQNRLGPNRVGIPLTKIRLAGFGQFAADGIKALIKEDAVPRNADQVVHFLAPVVMLIPVLLAYAVLPFGRNMILADYDAGLLLFFAVGGAVELSVFMAGWSSRNKYSLLGAMRAIAQMISYEIPLILSAVTVVIAPIYLSGGSLLTANCDVEVLLWMGCVYFAILAVKREEPRYWLWFGVVAGIGLEEKYSILVLGFAVVVGLLLTRQRPSLVNKWMWLGGLAALLIFLPNLLWNIHHGFPFVQLMHNIRTEGRDVVLTPWQYFSQQILLLYPGSSFIWIT